MEPPWSHFGGALDVHTTGHADAVTDGFFDAVTWGEARVDWGDNTLCDNAQNRLSNPLGFPTGFVDRPLKVHQTLGTKHATPVYL